MKEWFLSSDLMDLPGMPSTTAGISAKARREGWKSRKARGLSRAFEYHISSFDEQDLAELREKYGSEVIPDNVTEISNVKAIKDLSQVGELCAVPVYNVYASCGFGAQNDAEYQLRTELLPCSRLKQYGLNENTARIVICHGDSMEDTLSDGDEVLVDTRELEHPVKHGVYVVRIGKHVYIKRLKYDIMAEGYEVISDNKEEYLPFIVNGEKLQEFAVIGKVVTIVMKTVV
ncbi:helix-turn-helix domain-containing protein [Vibrio coralliilyticus]|uniref:helix-turn-helix domain-containing protein n=1 Tax=Vibrio coralliilyticus TaxID=190893 RepID=UPI00148B8470|nr:LexA family transcriptional regulator [Vibrio coralliilyticus]NOI32153.1 LexA family transcriptional regulator [Vibrio coralliilyticus]NOI51307.1 LexA family transcriptional regulator [Vibrio coralliilyticus]